MKIKTEKKAKRCEVCHQKDCFNEEINYCSRCSETKRELINIINSQSNKDPFGRDEIIQHLERAVQLYHSTAVTHKPLFAYDLEMPLKGARIGLITSILMSAIIFIKCFYHFSNTPSDLYGNYVFYDLGQYVFSVSIICVFAGMFIGSIFGFKKFPVN